MARRAKKSKKVKITYMYIQVNYGELIMQFRDGGFERVQ